jgi:hypothetical protein
MSQSQVNLLLLKIRESISRGTINSWEGLETLPDYQNLTEEEKTAIKHLAYEDISTFFSSAEQRRANSRASMDRG